MLRVGLMLDSFTTSAWISQIVEDIQSSDFAEIALVIMNTPPPPAAAPPLRKRLKNHWKQTLFHRYEQWDYQKHRAEPDAKAPRDLRPLLSNVPTLTVVPLRKGFTDRLREEDVQQVRSADMDVLFRFGFRIVRGPILGAARCGIWSFHHDDNLEYRGGPPLFWEIFEGNPISGTILQILTESLDGGRVIYRSHSSTDLTSLHRNRNPIYWKTANFAMRRLKDLHAHGIEFLRGLPTYDENVPYTRRIYRTPAAPQMLTFIAGQISRRVKSRITAKTKGGHLQWFLALRKRSPERSFSDATGYSLIRPPRNKFYADPFLVQRGGKTYLFFEDYRYAEHRALISCAEIGHDGSFGTPFEVLRRPYHLSYPFLFEHDGEMYMMPETKQNRTVELYRATDFPRHWAPVGVLLENIHAVDATILPHRGKLWMFAGVSGGNYSNSDELCIFHADNLLGPWTPHPANPVISDVRRARPAGALFREGGSLIRPSQDCGKAYGYALNFNEVLTLSETEYAERPLARITPDWLKHNLGTHTYSRTQDFEVIDGNFASKVDLS